MFHFEGATTKRGRKKNVALKEKVKSEAPGEQKDAQDQSHQSNMSHDDQSMQKLAHIS